MLVNGEGEKKKRGTATRTTLPNDAGNKNKKRRIMRRQVVGSTAGLISHRYLYCANNPHNHP